MKHLIPVLLLAATSLSSSAHSGIKEGNGDVRASTPSTEVRQVARALINNPDVTRRLKENISDVMTNLEITEVSRGVFKYQMRFIRHCECLPSTADVTIIEDMRPTEVDAPPKYTSSIKIQ